jgi:hypothetical protein
MTITIWPPQVVQAGRGTSETLGDSDMLFVFGADFRALKRRLMLRPIGRRCLSNTGLKWISGQYPGDHAQ